MCTLRLSRLQGVVCWLSSIFVALAASACGVSSPPGSNAAARPRPDQSGEVPSVQNPVIEDGYDNSVFEQAQPATLPVDGEIVIEGTIDSRGDIDIYAFGPAAAGDRIIIDVTGHQGLNTVAALFDADYNLIDANDDRSYYSALLDPYICQVIQADTDALYLGVAVSSGRYFASSTGRYDSGAYSIRVRRETGAALRTPRTQVVYLDFDGGSSVQIGLEPVEVMRPFSAESISGRLAGKTDYIINLIVEHMSFDLAPFDVQLLDSRHHARPPQPYSGLFFGSFNPSYLGLADNVDTGNLNLQQEAIIYSEDLALWEPLVPSAEEVALALANVAAHELGHLLGLEHTASLGDLMATAGTARQVLEIDAAFLRSPLQTDVFPAGFQDEVAVLFQNVGPNAAGDAAHPRVRDLAPSPPSNWRDEQNLPDIPINQGL